MQRRIALSIAILTFGFFCFFCIRVHSQTVERDITRRASEALAANGIAASALRVDGRDVVLSGPAGSPAVAADTRQLIAGISGVRTVDVQLDGPGELAPDSKTVATSSATQRKLDALLAKRVVEFSPASAELTARGRAVLDLVAPLLASLPAVTCEIQGHTDSRGNHEVNRKLSFKRAIATKNYLVNKGIPPQHLIAKAYGDSEPIASNKTEAGRRRNRRISFVLREKP